MHVIDCLLHGIIKSICSLTRIVLEMTFLLSKQLQCWSFDICNVIEVWILRNCGVVSIVTVCHYNGLIFEAIGYTYMILIIFDAIHRNCTQKSNTRSSGSYNLSRNGILRYIFSKTTAIRVMIIHCHKYGPNENESINKKHIFSLIMTVINVIDTIAYQIEILAAIYPVIDETLSFMVTRTAAIRIRFQFNFYFDGTDSLSFYYTTNGMYDFCPIVFVFISMVAIIFGTDHVYIILIMIAVVNVISIHKLNKTRNNGYKTSTIQFVCNRNTNIAIRVVHFEEINTNIYEMHKLCSIANKANNFDTIIIVINTINIIIHKISYISYFTMKCFDHICNLSCIAVYFIVPDYNVFELGLVASKKNTANEDKILKILQFIIVILVTARMLVEIIIIVLKWSSRQL